jgi:predicted transcriptional regulator
LVKTLTNYDVLDAVLLYKALIERDLASIKTILDRTEGRVRRTAEVNKHPQITTFADLARQAEAEMVKIETKKTL